ncbi:hypothetical protein [Kitasatospora sp. NPDC057223]|uniref:hypothetical protein n=1 Tax=Kitasatospora sp. NPDC057223 TaxID=3346055 RepID=UPI003633308B
MSQNHPRPPGGGSGDSPTERLLRAALGARAEQISGHDLRPAHPPSLRTRRLRPVYVVAVPLLGLAAATAFALLGPHTSPQAGREKAPPAATLTAVPSPAASEAPSPGPSPTGSSTVTEATPQAPPEDVPASPTSAPTGNRPVPYDFRGVRFQVPAGWTVVAPDPASTTLCVLSPGAPAAADTAACVPYGVVLAVYNTPDEVEHALWPTMADLSSDLGWSHQPYCPVWGNPHPPGAGDAYRAAGSPVETRDIVAGRAVHKTQWQGSCDGKETFTSQMWGLRTDQVLVAANGLKPGYQAALVSILDTLDLSGRPAPLLEPHRNDVDITVDGLGVGQQVSNDGAAVSFSVTYRNTSQSAYPAVRAVLYAEGYAGVSGAPPITEGTLERRDGAGWTPLTLGTGAAPLPGSDLVFRLAPGQSRTVEYRMRLTARDGAGVLPVTARAQLPSDGQGERVLGEKSIPVRVVVK